LGKDHLENTFFSNVSLDVKSAPVAADDVFYDGQTP
jgi:hypothetical protein